ncbi:MAG: hypothetical protein K2O00_04400 [Muribaculaceae bacterium]|nr:hypothetical protein [Muribaculaceae bacterium]
MKAKVLLIALMALMMISCGGGESENAVPRRYAYPRPALYPQTYVSAGGAPSLSLNAGAEIVADSLLNNGSRWVTVDYPHYNGSIYITFLATTPAEFHREFENRMERIGLNAGAGSMESVTVASEGGGFRGELFSTRGESVSPVQFLAYNKDLTLLTYGTFNFRQGVDVTRTDSLAPVINAVRNDMIHLLKHLDDK